MTTTSCCLTRTTVTLMQTGLHHGSCGWDYQGEHTEERKNDGGTNRAVSSSAFYYLRLCCVSVTMIN